MSSGYTLSEAEKNDIFREQRDALESSCRSFDEGKRWEAKRLATATYVLCHDPPTPRKHSLSKSLLGQLGLKHRLNYLSTKGNIPDGMIPWIPLAFMRANETAPFEFMPKLEVGQENWKWLSFSSWWEEPVFKTPLGKKLSRKNLVFAMRSQDGGSHADEVIRDEEYATLRRLNDERLQRSKAHVAGKPRIRIVLNAYKASKESDAADFEPIPGAHLVTMRQIAFELLSSIGRLI